MHSRSMINLRIIFLIVLGNSASLSRPFFLFRNSPNQTVRRPFILRNLPLLNVPSYSITHILPNTEALDPRHDYIPYLKLSLEQATKAQRGSRCIAVLFLQPRR